jgi:hypothetical protein
MVSGLFTVNMTQERSCQVKLKAAKLDFETTAEYRLQIRLDTFSGLVNPDRGTTTVSSYSLVFFNVDCISVFASKPYARGLLLI